MQIARLCPRAIAGFSFPSARRTVAALLATLGLCGPVCAAPTLTTARAVPERLPPLDAARSLTGWQLAALVAIRRGDIDTAWFALSHALTLAPHDFSLDADGLHYATMSGHIEAALTLAHTLPSDDISLLLLGETALLQKNWTELRHVLDRDNHPDALMNTMQPVLDAWTLAGQGQQERAISGLTDITTDPVRRKLYLLNAALISEQRPDRARTEALFRAAALTRRDPIAMRIVVTQLYANWLAQTGRRADLPAVLNAMGQDLARDSEIGAAVQKALLHTPQGDVRAGLGATDLQIGLLLASEARSANMHADLAINLLQISHHVAPSLDITNIVLADVLRSDHHLKDALRALSQIPVTSPFALLAIGERLSITDSLHDLDGEEQALRQALTLSPGSAHYLSMLGSVQAERGELDAAIESYTRALAAASPRKAELWRILLGRASAWENKGDWPRTREDMTHALELAPDNPMVLNFAGYASLEHDLNTTQAMTYLRHAVALAPSDASIQDSYAWGLLKTKADLATALPILIRAAEHEPDDPEIAYHLGVAYWYLGRRIEAQDQWNQALADAPAPHDRALLDTALRNGPHLASFERNK